LGEPKFQKKEADMKKGKGVKALVGIGSLVMFLAGPISILPVLSEPGLGPAVPTMGLADCTLVRANFLDLDAETDRVLSDGEVCPCGFDYADYQDNGDMDHPTCQPCGKTISDLSAGGRWHFFSVNPEFSQERWLVLRFPPPGNLEDNPSGRPCHDFDTQLAYTQVDPDPCIDFVQFRINADRVFKPNAQSQPFSISIVGPDAGAARFTLRWLTALEIGHPVPNDPDRVTLTTVSPHEAELTEPSDRPGRPRVIGTYKMPFKVELVKGPLCPPAR